MEQDAKYIRWFEEIKIEAYISHIKRRSQANFSSEIASEASFSSSGELVGEETQ